MSHELFDCVGLPLRGWDAVTRFVHDHWAELRGYPAPGGWFNAIWRDPSGAKLAVNVDERGQIEAVAGFAGPLTARITDVGWVEDSQALVAYVLDDKDEEITRFCAECDQWRFLPEISADEVLDAAVTGLAWKVRIYDSQAAFSASPDADMGPLSEPRTLPDGTVMNRLRFGPQSFIPVGMFQDPWNPMARLSATVDRSWTKTVEATGISFHVARVTTLDAFGIYLCWPTYLAPLAEPGQTVYSDAYLTTSVPGIWQRQRPPA